MYRDSLSRQKETYHVSRYSPPALRNNQGISRKTGTHILHIRTPLPKGHPIVFEARGNLRLPYKYFQSKNVPCTLVSQRYEKLLNSIALFV